MILAWASPFNIVELALKKRTLGFVQRIFINFHQYLKKPICFIKYVIQICIQNCFLYCDLCRNKNALHMLIYGSI